MDFNGDFFLGAMALQRDRKIVVAGCLGDSPALARFRTDGLIDIAFGNQGLVVTDARQPYVCFNAVTVQANGKITAVGSGEPDDILIRYNANGSLDNLYGNEGMASLDGFSNNESLALFSNGRAVVKRVFLEEEDPNNFHLMRFRENGTLDPAFSGDGILTTDLPDSVRPDMVTDLVLQSDGKSIATGVAAGGFVLTRYTAGGALDPTFGNNGLLMDPLGGDPATVGSHSIAIQQDGKILAAGLKDGEITVVRYKNDPAADLQLTIVYQPSPPQRNRDLTFIATIRNLGPDTATNVSFWALHSIATDRVRTSQGFCLQGNSEMKICGMGDIPAHGSAYVYVTVRPTRAGNVAFNASTGSADVRDPQDNNNAVNISVRVP